ncbi:radical SAM protein [Paenibacillus sp. FSL H7-0350]|uniref:radical SAM protein n=1 Tax=Paenibacillus sp. FSL H7-0350 TaxID=2975345 RepID=UPI0031587915
MFNKNFFEYNLTNYRKVYFSPYVNRFWMDSMPDKLEQDYNDTKLSKMRLEITHLCNGNCSYCIVFGNKVEKKESLNVKELWEWLLIQPWFKEITEIFIIGGEPLICFDDINFIMENFDGEIRFSTNGTLLTDKMAKKLARRNVFVYISLDGPQFQDNLMRVYKGGGYMYNDIIRGINILISAGVNYGFFMVATKDNIRIITDVIGQIDETFHPLKIGYSMPHWTENNFDEISGEEYRDALSDLYKHRKMINAEIMQISWRIKPLLKGKIKKFSCGLHTSQTTVLPDKSIVRCSKIDDDPVYKKITNDEMNQNCPLALAEKGVQSCASCIALASCGGGCPFDGLKRFNGFLDKRECIITPQIVNMAVKDILLGLENRKDIPSGILSLETIKEFV